jgi:hypothetical protein
MTVTSYSPKQLADWASDVIAEYDKEHGLREAMAIVGIPDESAPAVLAVCHEILHHTEDAS